jgi:AhpD family alkylhydroperoxidase
VAFIESIDDIDAGPQRNMRSVFAHRPAVLAAWRQLLGAITADMDERRYELVTLAAAGSLRSSYCALAHGSVLLERHVSEAELLTLALSPDSAPLTPVEHAAMRFARKVVEDATSVSAETSPSCGIWASPIRRSSTSRPQPPRAASSAKRSTRSASSPTRSTRCSRRSYKRRWSRAGRSTTRIRRVWRNIG